MTAAIRDPTDDTRAAAAPTPRPRQPLIAYRAWRIVDGALCSPYDGSVWSAAGLTASCRPRNADDLAREAHPSPSPSCGCGIGASLEPDLGICGVDAAGVVGVVGLWGRVVLQAGSLRAEHAEVIMLGAYLHWSRRQRIAAVAVAERLGCGLVPLETIRARAEELLGAQALELDAGTAHALRGAAPTLVRVPAPTRPFVPVR